MPTRPYDTPSRKDGELFFLAALPAFADIGRNFRATPEHSVALFEPGGDAAAWREIVEALQAAQASATEGKPDLTRLEAAGQRYPDLCAMPLRNALLVAGVGAHGPSDVYTISFPDLYPLWREHHLPTKAPPAAAALRKLRDSLTYMVAIGEARLREKEKRPRRATSGGPGRRTKKQQAVQYRFSCGRRAEVTAPQKELFDELEKQQQEVAHQVMEAVRELYKSMTDTSHLEVTTPGFVHRPAAAPGSEPLDRFHIECFHLAARGRLIGLSFATKFPHFDEHGCGVLLDNWTVTDFGDGEVLMPLDEDE